MDYRWLNNCDKLQMNIQKKKELLWDTAIERILVMMS